MSSMTVLRETDPIEVLDAYRKTGSIEGTARLLNVSTKAKCVREFIKQIVQSTDPTALRKLATRNNYTNEDIYRAVSESICMSDVLRKLGLTTHGANAIAIKQLMIEQNVDFSHFNASTAMQRNKHRWRADQIFIEHSPLPRSSLHSQVVRMGVLGPSICTDCGISTTYNGKAIQLTVDHINGINDDNRIENLRWLCPNCHSQTDNYGGKAVKLRTK